MFFAVVVLLNALILLFVHEPTEWGDYKDQNLIIVRDHCRDLVYTHPSQTMCCLQLGNELFIEWSV